MPTLRIAALSHIALIGSLLFASSLAAQQVLTLPATDRPLRATVEEVYRIGGSAAEGWSAFDVVREVGFDGAGNLHVLDRRGARLVIVDRAGRLARQVGRRGRGPGEFQVPDALAVAQDGSFTIYDVVARSFIRFDADAEFVRNERPHFPLGNPGRLSIARDGTIFSQARLFTMNGTAVIDGPTGDMVPATTMPLYRVPFGRGDGYADTARLVHSAWLAPRPNPGVPFASYAFLPRLSWSALADGRLVVADTVDYTIDVVRPAGGLAATWRRPIAPRRVTDDDRDHARRERRAELIGPDGRPRIGGASVGGSDPQRTGLNAVEAAIAAMRFADVVPVIERLAVDGSDRVWVQRAGARADRQGPIDLLSSSGEYLGTIPPGSLRLPDAFGPDGLAAYIETDDLDAIVIVVRRIVVGSGS